MGRAGMPVDQSAWEEKRKRAIRLLGMGYSQIVVARNVGASKSWVQRIDSERRELQPVAN